MFEVNVMVAGADVPLRDTVNHPDPLPNATVALKPPALSWASVEMFSVWVCGAALPIVSLNTTVAGLTSSDALGPRSAVRHAPFQNAARTHRRRAALSRPRTVIVGMIFIFRFAMTVVMLRSSVEARIVPRSL